MNSLHDSRPTYLAQSLKALSSGYFEVAKTNWMSLSERLRPSSPPKFLETWWASSDWLELMQGLANLIYNMKGSQNSGGILNRVILVERLTWNWVFTTDSHTYKVFTFPPMIKVASRSIIQLVLYAIQKCDVKN